MLKSLGIGRFGGFWRGLGHTQILLRGYACD